MFQGQIGKITSQNPGKSGNFPVLFLSSTCPSLKSAYPPPKVIFLEIAGIGLSFHKVWLLDNCKFWKHVKIGCFQYCFVNEWLKSTR